MHYAGGKSPETGGGKAVVNTADSQQCSDLLVEIETQYSPQAGKIVPPYLKSMCGFSHPGHPN